MSATLALIASLAISTQAPSGLRAPHGFVVTEFAGSELANDIYCMTIDPMGRVVVSGRGYVKILVDQDHDGRADRALPFADEPADGAMGMLWEGDALYFTGGGGLRRLRDANQDGQADGPSELIGPLKTGGEHEAHAIRRGPDGWLYVICGNATGINRSFATVPTSPIVDPVAGCVVRFSADFQQSEIVADGFRNAYDMDFNPDGELFAYDSDNERCVSLPWYEPTRFYHVIPGNHYGWLNPQFTETWRRPPSFLDVAEPVCTLGRGSPTGVACYRHVSFPQEYQGGFFLADWTFGRVHFVKPLPSGATFHGEPRVFLEATGRDGFAPTDLAVHPLSGDLYVSIGGRGTRGAVYRVRWEKPDGAFDLTAIAALQPAKRSLDWQPSLETRLRAEATGEDRLRRRQALDRIQRFHDRLETRTVDEAMAANWGESDRSLRMAAGGLIKTTRGRFVYFPINNALQQTTLDRAFVPSAPHSALESLAIWLEENSDPAHQTLDLVRDAQIQLGDIGSPRYRGNVWEGYTPRIDPNPLVHPLVRARLVNQLRVRIPSSDRMLQRELGRTLAILEDDDPDVLKKLAHLLTPGSDPVEDIHNLIVISRLKARRTPEVTERVTAALLALDRKLDDRKANRDRNWPLRIAELTIHLVRKDRALNAAILSSTDFGRPDHVVFTHAPGFDRTAAAEIVLGRATKDGAFPWTAELIELIDELPAERTRSLLLRLVGTAGLDEAILPILARQPEAADLVVFLDGLRSPQLPTIDASLDALTRLPGGPGPEAIPALVRTLSRLPRGQAEAPIRDRLVQALQRVAENPDLGDDAAAWTAWLARSRPELAAKLVGSAVVDMSTWKRRLDAIDWSSGDAARGFGIFRSAGCATCHDSGRAVGPDLAGIAGRFSRDDRFTAILDPSRDVSPRYQSLSIATRDGRIREGVVIYEAVDGMILQTGATTTERLQGDEIEARRSSSTSIMPVGLLDRLTDGEVADLDAYLGGLGAAR